MGERRRLIPERVRLTRTVTMPCSHKHLTTKMYPKAGGSGLVVKRCSCGYMLYIPASSYTEPSPDGTRMIKPNDGRRHNGKPRMPKPTAAYTHRSMGDPSWQRTT